MLTAIVGTNWGDEGKGRMVDLLSEKYDIVVPIRAAITQATPLSTIRASLSLTCCPQASFAARLST